MPCLPCPCLCLWSVGGSRCREMYSRLKRWWETARSLDSELGRVNEWTNRVKIFLEKMDKLYIILITFNRCSNDTAPQTVLSRPSWWLVWLPPAWSVSPHTISASPPLRSSTLPSLARRSQRGELCRRRVRLPAGLGAPEVFDLGNLARRMQLPDDKVLDWGPQSG